MRRSRTIALGVLLLAAILLTVVVLRRDRGAPAPAPQGEAAAPATAETGDATKAPSPAGAKAAAPAAAARGKAATAPASATSGASKVPPRSPDRSVAKAAGPTTAAAAAKVEPSAPAQPPPPAAAADAVAAAGEEDGGASGAIAGILIDARGQPFALTTVVAVAASGDDAAETLTADDGSFLLPGLRPGRYAVFPGLGTELPTRLGARGVTVKPTTVSRVAFAEPRPGGTVRVASLDGAGRPTAAQAVLIADTSRDAGGYGSLLAADAVYLPELGGSRTVLRNVPPGSYRVVLLRTTDEPAVAAPEPVRVTGGSELGVTVRIGAAAAIPPG